MNNNYEYQKLNSQIGEIRMRRAFALKNTGCFVLCGSFIGTCLINNPSIPAASVLGIDLSVATYYGIRSYLYQRKINNLKEELKKVKKKDYPN